MSGNVHKGETELTLSTGETYELVLDMEALFVAEQIYGKGIPDLFADVVKGMVSPFRAIIYGALRARHPEVSPATVAEWCRTELDAMSAAVNRLNGSFPPQEGEQSQRPPKKKAKKQTGTVS